MLRDGAVTVFELDGKPSHRLGGARLPATQRLDADQVGLCQILPIHE